MPDVGGTVELAEVALVERGLSWSKDQETTTPGTGLLPVVRIGNVQRSGLDMSSPLYLRGIDIDRNQRRIIEPATIIMVGSNGNADRIGNVCLAGDDVVGHAYASFLIGIRPHDSADARFLFHLLRAPSTQRMLTESTSGSTGLKNVSLTTVRSMKLPWPSRTRRKRVADVMDAVDRAQVASKLHRARASTLLALAIDSYLAASGNWTALPESWELGELGAVASIRSGITKGRRSADPVTPRPFLRAANVQHGFLDLSTIHTFAATDAEAERFLLRTNDVLLIEGGSAADVGRGWIWEGQVEGCIHQNHVFRARITDARVAPRFLAYAICASPARAYCLSRSRQSSNLASINKTQISAMPIPIPPAVEQEAIVSRLDAMKTMCEAADDEGLRLACLYDSVVSRLVEGRDDNALLPEPDDLAIAGAA